MFRDLVRRYAVANGVNPDNIAFNKVATYGQAVTFFINAHFFANVGRQGKGTFGGDSYSRLSHVSILTHVRLS